MGAAILVKTIAFCSVYQVDWCHREREEVIKMSEPLGHLVLLALAEQGWLVVASDEWVTVVAPSREFGAALPAVLFTDPECEGDLRYALVLLSMHGFVWPWPEPGKPRG